MSLRLSGSLSVMVLLVGCAVGGADESLGSTRVPRDADDDAGDDNADDDDADDDDADDAVGPDDDAADAAGEGDDDRRGPPWPIILVHGFSGWMDIGGVDYFYEVKDDLRAAGADVTAPNLPPYNSSADRAVALAGVVDEVLARTQAQKVHLIAHSQGGIDSRVLITDLGYADRVASVVTISTPHRGTLIADVASAAPDGVLNPAGRLLGWLLGTLEGDAPTESTWLADEDVDAAPDPRMADAITTLSTATRTAFNETHPDPPGVAIFSVAGVTNLRSLAHPACDEAVWERSDRIDVVDALLTGSGVLLSGSDGGAPWSPTPNDGLVTVASSRWGTFLGCIPADHFDEIGQILDDGNLVSGFDHRRFYLRLLEQVRQVEHAAATQ
jgi:triacylglycerol lipase